jgi:hypothetical protein
MLVYLVIFSSSTIQSGQYYLKTIHRVVPTTLNNLQESIVQCSDLLNNYSLFPLPQWEIVSRPDNTFLEQMVEK